MTNRELLVKAKSLAGEERKIAAEVIEHLREVDRRLLHFEMGYASLHEFCEKELGYSSGAAARRIASMRLVRDMPETKEMLVSGKLSLETMQAVQIHFRKEKPTLEVKKELLASVVGKSKREVEKIVHPEETYSITLTQKEYELLQQLKAAVGSSNLEKVLSESLKRVSPASSEIKASASRYIPQSLKRAVIKRDQARCTYPGCTETRHLQFDHKQPFALGGETTLQNLRLLCSAHNKLEAYNAFGSPIPIKASSAGP